MINSVSTEGTGVVAPRPSQFNPLTQSDIDKQLKRMEYDLAEERAMLVHKLIETQGVNTTTAHMQVNRLIKRGVLSIDGKVVRSPKFTNSQIHTFTGGGGDVNSVIN